MEGPALSYSLIRLKPAPHCLPRFPMEWTACMQRRGFTHVPVHHTSVKSRRVRSHDTLYRWFFVYLPVIALVLVLLYFLAEIFMKHMAMYNIQQQWKMLPETVEDLPLAPQSKKAPSVPGAMLSPKVIGLSPKAKPESVAPKMDAGSTVTKRRPAAPAATLPPLQFSHQPSVNHEGQFSAAPTHQGINLDFLALDVQSSWGAQL